MRLIHDSPWTEQELQVYYDIIATNIYDGLKELATVLRKAEIEVMCQLAVHSNLQCADTENNKRARYYTELGDYPPIDDQEKNRALSFWQDAGVQKAFEAMKSDTTFNLGYFMDRLEDISKADYVPTSEDILHSRQRSTGASETCFVVCMGFFMNNLRRKIESSLC